MKKAQIISMDFVMTFVVYILALSLFFFLLKDNFSSQSELNLDSEIVFGALTNVYDLDYNFLDSSKINDNFATLLNNYEGSKAYELYFKQYEEPGFFSRMDYCIYLEKFDGRIIKNFEAFRMEKEDDYAILFFDSAGDEYKCGQEKHDEYLTRPKCVEPNAESIVLSKPVLYDDEIVNLNVFVCAKKR